MDGLSGDKANLSPAKLKLADIGLELSLAKEKQLECPVGFEVAQPPIFMCSESHLICCECQPNLEKCSECRRKYNAPPKIHRYTVEMVEELTRMINEKKKFQS